MVKTLWVTVLRDGERCAKKCDGIEKLAQKRVKPPTLGNKGIRK